MSGRVLEGRGRGETRFFFASAEPAKALPFKHSQKPRPPSNMSTITQVAGVDSWATLMDIVGPHAHYVVEGLLAVFILYLLFQRSYKLKETKDELTTQVCVQLRAYLFFRRASGASACESTENFPPSKTRRIQ
jgi:hypothetical protein